MPIFATRDFVTGSVLSGSTVSGTQVVSGTSTVSGTLIVTGSAQVSVALTSSVVNVPQTLAANVVNISGALTATVANISGAATASAVNVTSENWDDLQGQTDQAAGTGGLTYQQYGTSGHSMYFFRHDQDDSLHLKFQMPHSWDPTTSVRVHIHFIPHAVPATDEVIWFAGKYQWSQVGVTTPTASWTDYSSSFTVSGSATGSAGKQWARTLVEVAPASGSGESNFLLITVIRSGTDSRDTYTTTGSWGTNQANVALLGVDVHFRKVKQGTTAEFPGA